MLINFLRQVWRVLQKSTKSSNLTFETWHIVQATIMQNVCKKCTVILFQFVLIQLWKISDLNRVSGQL